MARLAPGSVRCVGAQLRFTKWGGKRHWRFEAEPLGEDAYGRWFGLRAGASMRRGFEEPIRNKQDCVILVPEFDPWIATFNAPGPTKIAVYVDVTTIPDRDGDIVHAVDLDLDVVRLTDGSVRVLDEDEFAEHQVLYGYPADVIRRAQATADHLVERITASVEPFGRVGAAHLAEYTARAA